MKKIVAGSDDNNAMTLYENISILLKIIGNVISCKWLYINIFQKLCQRNAFRVVK